MRVGLAQMNPKMGDISGNTQKTIEYMERAKDKHCDLLVFPELCLLGYNPNDLLERAELIKALPVAVKKISREKPKGMSVVIGSITPSRYKSTKPFHNSAIVLTDKNETVISKSLLPSYDVFDETRFLTPGDPKKHLVKVGKWNVLVLVCEDIWGWERTEYESFLHLYKQKKVDLVVSINGSPFTLTKAKRRKNVVTQTARYFCCPVVYVNCVGGQDEVIYDGGSFVVDAQGKLLAQSAVFSEDLNIIDFSKKVGGKRKLPQGEPELLRQALVLGIRDFANKNNFKKIHLGISGGIDSAVVMALAADALGPHNITGIAMPGPFSAPESLVEARQLCKNLGCKLHTIDICSSYQQLLQTFEEEFGPQKFGVLHENIQARLRGMYLMMYANFSPSLLLATSNKSELATGYSTLYGDMCGGLAPIGDLLKKQVYALAELYNKEAELIPKKIIARPPSAELRPNQKDQDTLPPYDELDRAVDKIVSRTQPASGKTEEWLLKRLAATEFKRWQAPPVLRISDHAFGRGRRLPITNGFYS
ncbi:MAG: NAD+ synthase [Bdellovibrionaceae bacterium]|nr:NAD+ synthase [Pseudobdellovibrionaceae bacterium]